MSTRAISRLTAYVRTMVAVPATFILLTLLCAPVQAQPRLDERSIYQRVRAIVPIIGTGTAADPKRPKHAPSLAEIQLSATTRSGILAFAQVLSDDGNFALVEFVARDPKAFQEILADPTIITFLPGRDRREDMEAAFLKYKKNFNFMLFGARVQ